jgi:hypothetical protein
MSLYFLRRRWGVRYPRALSIACAAGILTNPTWTVALSLVWNRPSV